MRGNVDQQPPMFIAFNLEERVPADHPLRPIKRMCDRILSQMSRDFTRAYGKTGRVGIPPECLIKALLLRALFSIPSEIKLCEACEFNLLYRWFIDWRADRIRFAGFRLRIAGSPWATHRHLQTNAQKTPLA
jgi:transposase